MPLHCRYRQRCFDAECRGYASPAHPLPEAAAEEIFDVLASEAADEAEKLARLG